jgi:deazaflavin-dependent oxidoreductase (nitroreductase family)
MPDSPEPVVDSPTPWVAEHIKQYVGSDGREGHLWRGVPTLLLTVTGRKTGRRLRSALIYGRDGDNYVVVASKGGSPKHPLWFLNLRDNPDVELQVGSDTFPARARVTGGAERERLWQAMTKIWPDYNAYQARTTRQIPVVVLEPVAPAQ